MTHQIEAEEKGAVESLASPAEETTPGKEELVSIPASLLQRTVDYLVKQPYVEVYLIMNDILASTSNPKETYK